MFRQHGQALGCSFVEDVSSLLVLPGRRCHELTPGPRGWWRSRQVLQSHVIFLSLCWDFLVNFEMGVLFYSKAQELGDMKRGGRGDMD